MRGGQQSGPSYASDAEQERGEEAQRSPRRYSRSESYFIRVGPGYVSWTCSPSLARRVVIRVGSSVWRAKSGWDQGTGEASSNGMAYGAHQKKIGKEDQVVSRAVGEW